MDSYSLAMATRKADNLSSHQRSLRHKFQKFIEVNQPIPVEGNNNHKVPEDRDVLWKNICIIGQEQRECFIEMSQAKLKFYIIAVDMKTGKYHVIELWLSQAKNVVRACNGDLHTLMTYLEFKFGKLQIKDFELLLQHELFSRTNHFFNAT